MLTRPEAGIALALRWTLRACVVVAAIAYRAGVGPIAWTALPCGSLVALTFSVDLDE
jgi:hypothetical protein